MTSQPTQPSIPLGLLHYVAGITAQLPPPLPIPHPVLTPGMAYIPRTINGFRYKATFAEEALDRAEALKTFIMDNFGDAQTRSANLSALSMAHDAQRAFWRQHQMSELVEVPNFYGRGDFRNLSRSEMKRLIRLHVTGYSRKMALVPTHTIHPLLSTGVAAVYRIAVSFGLSGEAATIANFKWLSGVIASFDETYWTDTELSPLEIGILTHDWAPMFAAAMKA